MKPCRWLGPLLAIAVMAVVTTENLALAEDQSLSPAELVRRTALNEINGGNRGERFLFLDRKQTPSGSQAKLMVETPQGIVGMLVAQNDKPLDTQQRQAEDARLAALVTNPEAIRKKQRNDKEDSARIERIMRALPDAFLYEQNGTEPGRQGVGEPGVELIRLSFRPNPKYVPPSHVELVLTGMSGTLLIDAHKLRIARMDGILTKEVGFGWGILGHLDKGGHFLVEQGEIGDNCWQVTHMKLEFTGKELFFKSININSNETFSGFQPAPANLTVAQAVTFLKKHEAEVAENHQAKS